LIDELIAVPRRSGGLTSGLPESAPSLPTPPRAPSRGREQQTQTEHGDDSDHDPKEKENTGRARYVIAKDRET
jgi:hypothetical protein